MKDALRVIVIACLALLALAARFHNLRDVFIDGRIYFVDADCYSRMARVRMVAERPGSIIRHHAFENYPTGITPHTTAPLDYLIAGMVPLVSGALRIADPAETSVLHAQSLDVAGALLSPLLGLAGLLFLGAWFWMLKLRSWGGALFLYAISPILVHGTSLGRPDHQSLLIFLLNVAVCAEIAIVRSSGLVTRIKSWGIASGAAWALSLWVSLYEPLILLAIVAALWLLFDRRGFLARPRIPGAVVFLVILAVALLLEGWRIATPDPATRAYFGNWKRMIGELSHLDLRSPLLYSWVGFGVVAAPFILAWGRTRDRCAVPLLILLVALIALSIWQVRWGYFLALIFVISIPWQFAAIRKPWVVWLPFIAALWPVFRSWDTQLFPDAMNERQQAVRRTELTALREIVATQAGASGGSFIAPWWLSPPIAYWTRNAGVAGSSHESLPGIVDTARFYLGSTADEVAPILRARDVRWILADDPSRVVSNSAALLGIEPPSSTLAAALTRRAPPPGSPDTSLPSTWEGPLENQFYKIWKVKESAPLQPSP